MFDGTNLTLFSDVDQDKKMFGCMKDPLLIDVSSLSTYNSRYKKVSTQQYIQLYTGVK